MKGARILPATYRRQVAPLHYHTWPGDRTLCGGRGAATTHVPAVTCRTCREKYFGHAGTDPVLHASSTTD